MGQEFDVLGTMRAIRKDKLLSASAKALLVFAALRANKHDGKVRASLEMLAEDAGLSRRTVERALAKDQHETLKYFSRVERSRRRVDLWFNLDPSTTQCPPSTTPCRTECDTVSHHLPLSTSTSTSRSTRSTTRSTTTEVPSLGREPVEGVWALSEKEPAKPANPATKPSEATKPNIWDLVAAELAKKAQPATQVASLPISKSTKPSEATKPDIWAQAKAELAKKSGGEEDPQVRPAHQGPAFNGGRKDG